MEIFKLGAAPKKEDSRNLRLSSYLKLDQLPPIPDAIDYAAQSGVKDFGMMANDRHSDCVWAAYGHKIMVDTGLNGDLFTPSDADILNAYASTGFNPKNGHHDNGTVELVGNKYMQKTGIAGHKWGPFVEVNAQDQQEVKTAIFLFGPLIVGVRLPLSMQGQEKWSKIPADGNDRDTTAGSWGGHGVAYVGYSGTGTRVITWGKVIDCDWDFAVGRDDNGAPYVVELYATISADWVTDVKKAPNGFDMQSLLNDLNEVQK